MKNSYSPPKLTVYGSVEKITQAQGPSLANDMVIITGLTPDPLEITVPQGGSINFSTSV